MASINAVKYLDETNPDDLALALDLYSGNFAEAYRHAPKLFNTSLPVIHRKTMTQGKSYSFLMMADTPDPEKEFDPGNFLAGQDYAVKEGEVTRDKYIVAHHWVPRDQMKTDHFEIIPRLARADARKIGMEGDRRLFTIAALMARAAAVSKNGLTVHNGGNRVTRTAASIAAAYPLSSVGAANLVADMRQLAEQMDDDLIPEEGRYAWAPPYIRHVLQYDNTAQIFSEDYIDGENKVQKRMITQVAGFKIVDWVSYTSNGGSLPNQNFTTGPAKFRANFEVGASNGTPALLVLGETADGGAPVSMGTWESVQNVVHYDPTRMSWLVASFILAGIGGMHPWGAGSIEVISSSS